VRTVYVHRIINELKNGESYESSQVTALLSHNVRGAKYSMSSQGSCKYRSSGVNSSKVDDKVYSPVNIKSIS